MMDIAVVAVGKLQSYYREACDEYARRMGRYATFEEREVREGRGGSPVEVERDEGRRLLAKLSDRSILIALARDGSGWTSSELAERMRRWSVESRPIGFVIGGSTGLGGEILNQAQYRWSLGPLTLPHQLARVVVFEQLYRAFTILRGEPYHKGKV